MSTRPQHEMAHLFHNFIITLARRNAVFTASQIVLPGPEGSDEHWRGWAREEEKKRIALFAFILDAQHATIFRQIPALSAFQLQLYLPCEDEEWTKESAEEWIAYRRLKGYKPPSFFIPALKASLMPGRAPPALDTFSRFVLLHGLMSIAYDLMWKQNVLLGAESASSDSGIANWKDKLSTAYGECEPRPIRQQTNSFCTAHRASLSPFSVLWFYVRQARGKPGWTRRALTRPRSLRRPSFAQV